MMARTLKLGTQTAWYISMYKRLAGLNQYLSNMNQSDA